jgi:Cu/Zn superoxide dismutase
MTRKKKAAPSIEMYKKAIKVRFFSFLFFSIIKSKSIKMVNAVAVLKGNDVSGVVKFSQASENDPVLVEASFTGLKPGKHGFHIHEFGDNTNGKKKKTPREK